MAKKKSPEYDRGLYAALALQGLMARQKNPCEDETANSSSEPSIWDLEELAAIAVQAADHLVVSLGVQYTMTP